MFFINIERLLLVIIIQGVPETCDSQGYTAWSVTYFCFCKSVLRNSIVPQCALDCCRFFGTPCILYYTLYSLKEMFLINKGSSQIRAAIPYLTDQIRAKVSLTLICSALPLFD